MATLELPERMRLHGDDTLFHKSGRQVHGAGSFRDPIRSRGQQTVYAWALNLVVLSIEVRPPWGGEPLALPINVRLYKKGGPSHLDLMQQMVEEVAASGGRRFDGREAKTMAEWTGVGGPSRSRLRMGETPRRPARGLMTVRRRRYS